MGISDIWDGVKAKIQLSSQNIPKHVAIAIDGCEEYAEKSNLQLKDVYTTKFLNIKNLIKIGVKLNIPIMTFGMEPLKTKEEEANCLAEFFNLLLAWEFIAENQIKVSVLGKWYDLPDRVIEPIKKVIANTKDYDKFFLNLCINYDGQQEIVDACKLVAQQVKLDKIAPESIDKAVVKENIYASYFLPPDLMIKTGKSRKLNGLLLWDSVHSKVYFSEVLWPEFGKEDFLKSIAFYQSSS